MVYIWCMSVPGGSQIAVGVKTRLGTPFPSTRWHIHIDKQPTTALVAGICYWSASDIYFGSFTALHHLHERLPQPGKGEQAARPSTM